MGDLGHHLSTVSVHAGEIEDSTGSLETPIFLSSAFAFSDSEQAEGAFRGENKAYIYGRWGNPNVEVLERKIAALEQTEDAAVAASGMAAISGAVLGTLCTGDHIVAPRSMYGEAARLFRERLPRLGIETTFVDDLSLAGFSAAITPRTRLVYLETPANPTLAITDIEAVAKLAHEHNAKCFVDNTFATPFCQRPLALGADLVIHSVTKFLGGHGDAIGGAFAGSQNIVRPLRESVIKGYGGALSPFNAFLIARGLRTFALRMAQSTRSACELAAWLETHPAIERVHHPSLPSHPGYLLAKKQMRAMPAIFSFEVKGGIDACRKLIESVKIITHAVSLGDVRSLVVHPATTTASTMPSEDRRRAGITDGLVRFAVGIEDTDDLRNDLGSALEGLL